MKLAEIRALIELVESSEISELEVAQGDEKIRIVKPSGAPASPAVTYAPAGAAPPATEQTPSESDTAPEEFDGHALKSPMVGTFYRAPSPDATPFADVGDRVQVGQVLCIVEAMKLMNEIEADVAGTIEAILVENAQGVEFGQPLLTIRPD